MDAKSQARNSAPSGFTFVELLVVIAIIGVLAALLLASLRTRREKVLATVCMDHGKQLAEAWRMYAGDNSDGLPAASEFEMTNRPNWFTGNISYDDFWGSPLSQWDTNQDMVRSPLWTYVGRAPEVFKCPADGSTVQAGTIQKPRIRSVSMSQAFAWGGWLDKTYVWPPVKQQVWRIYDRLSAIIQPAETFVFVDEHPDSINDGGFGVACTDADTPAAWIVDFPASFHNGGAGFAFSDGHSEIHKWSGSTIRPPVRYSSDLTKDIPAGDSCSDIRWLAEHTTVRISRETGASFYGKK